MPGPPPITVLNLTKVRYLITAENVPALMELFGMLVLPLAVTKVAVDICGVAVSYVNALRRTLIDEMTGYALHMPPENFNTTLTTEVFMLPGFVGDRIANICLRPEIPPEVAAGLRLKLDVKNTTDSPLAIYAGDLEVEAGKMPFPIFNPTTEIAVIMPGARLVIGGIYIKSGVGRDNAIYNNACCGSYTHLDLEQYSDAEMRKEGGAAVSQSGYKLSSLVANPRCHRLSVYLPATSDNYHDEVHNRLSDGCSNIIERLRVLATSIEQHVKTPAGGLGGSGYTGRRGVQYTVVELESGLAEGTLRVPNETHTIGELLRSTIFERTPSIANVAYVIVSHENHLSLSVRHTEDVTHVILDAIKFAIASFDTIRLGLAAASGSRSR